LISVTGKILKVLFLLPYPLSHAPSQRFRVEAYFDLLKRYEIDYDTDVFLDEAAWKVLYQGGSVLQKVTAVVKGYLRRFNLLFCAHKHDYIFIHREAAPLGPPVIEWILGKVLRKKLIFDFDDAIWIPNITETNRLARSLKCFWKIRSICKWSYKVSAGNAFLARWSGQYNNTVVINPTCVDTVSRYNRRRQQSIERRVVIGWTGSHSTLKYLDTIYPVLQKLEQEYEFEFMLICNQPPQFNFRSLKFMGWQEATEIEDLLQMDIGIMPLTADAWSEGKCGFKLIQYLALGIPALASPVGVNKNIIEHGINGFLCATEGEWYTALKTLLDDPALRARMGEKGREKMQKEYSVQSNAANFLSLFEQ
jgi:glycosyltransferase involved in cell wall biosynthesis